MALAIDFAQEDIQRGKLITPAWYRVHINDVEQKLSKDGTSTNYLITGTIIKDSDTGNVDFAGFPTPYWNFNSKAKGFMIGFFAALGFDVEAGKRYDLEAAKGKDIEIFIENELYEGRMINRINHKYRKASE
jgi:hypothetical protein